jgi:hypothetical protein
MKISPYTTYLEMQPNALLVRQNFIICKKWVLHSYKVTRVFPDCDLHLTVLFGPSALGCHPTPITAFIPGLRRHGYS